ncbi:MAG: anti-sigma factor [Pseudomonadota bacterium]
MTQKTDSAMLSAYLDGELAEDDVRAVDAALAADPGLQAELEALMEADALAQSGFDAMLDEPVPHALAAAIASAPLMEVANDPRAPRGVAGWIAASITAAALLVGGAVGFYSGQSLAPEIADSRSWLDDIADYHAVYAEQVRHLVEVPAEEAAHIQTWLSATLGVEVVIPDLGAHGLSFEGARLLVAAGRPVAQLVYTDAEGQVVALCQIASAAPQSDFATRTTSPFEMVTWGNAEANFVVISDEGRGDLGDIASTAAIQI